MVYVHFTDGAVANIACLAPFQDMVHALIHICLIHTKHVYIYIIIYIHSHTRLAQTHVSEKTSIAIYIHVYLHFSSAISARILALTSVISFCISSRVSIYSYTSLSESSISPFYIMQCKHIINIITTWLYPCKMYTCTCTRIYNVYMSSNKRRPPINATHIHVARSSEINAAANYINIMLGLHKCIIAHRHAGNGKEYARVGLQWRF